MNRDDAPLADEPQPGAIPNDQPSGASGMPPESEETEPPPMGTEEERPEGEGEAARGEEAQPGIPHEGEPPSSA